MTLQLKLGFQKTLSIRSIRLVRTVRYTEIVRYVDPDGTPAEKMSKIGFGLSGVASNDLLSKDHS